MAERPSSLIPDQIKESYWWAKALGTPQGDKFADRLGKTAKIQGIDLEKEWGERGSGVVGTASKKAARGIR